MRAQFFLKSSPGSGSGYKVPETFAILSIKFSLGACIGFKDCIILVSAICQQEITNKLTN